MTGALTEIPFGALVSYRRIPDEEGNHLETGTVTEYLEENGPWLYLGPHPLTEFADLGFGRVWVPTLGTGRYQGGPHEVDIEALTVVAVHEEAKA